MTPRIGDRVRVRVANSSDDWHGELVAVERYPTTHESRMATVRLDDGTRILTADWTLSKEVQA